MYEQGHQKKRKEKEIKCTRSSRKKISLHVSDPIVEKSLLCAVHFSSRTISRDSRATDYGRENAITVDHISNEDFFSRARPCDQITWPANPQLVIRYLRLANDRCS